MLRLLRAPAVLLAAGLVAPSARAADVGEIALVSDTAGNILPAIALPNIYLERTMCAFLQTHPDQYDAVFVFTNAQLTTLTRVEQGWPVKGAALGIGRDNSLDSSARFCTHRLRHAVKLGDLRGFDDDPDQQYPGLFLFPLTGIELVAHEFGHQWLASVRFDRGDGVVHCLNRGYEPTGMSIAGNCDGYDEGDFNQHWSYFFNSGSVMYGNTIRDLGGGQFELSNPSPKYGPLDQYLMGLRDPSEVPPMFAIDVGDVATAGSASLPLSHSRTAMQSGTRIDFSIDDVIRAEGPRVPPREQCHWKGAFIIVHDPASPPSAAEIAKTDTYRRRWEGFYDWATDQRGSFDTTLAGSGGGTPGCSGAASPPFDAGPASDARPTGVDARVNADASPSADTAASTDAAPTEPDAEATMPDAGPSGFDAKWATADDAAEPSISGLKSADGCQCSSAKGERRGGPPLIVLLLLALVHQGARKKSWTQPPRSASPAGDKPKLR